MPAPRHFHRTLTDIRAALDAGPEWYSGSEAAAALGLNLCTFNTWATEGRIPRKRSKPHGLGGRMWHYHKDALWRFVQDVYGYVPHDESEAARTAVLAMLERWQDCPTIQQLHDAAHVRPLPAYVTRPDYGHGSRPHSLTATSSRSAMTAGRSTSAPRMPTIAACAATAGGC